jgi:two-component system nitrogen regulation sensor histidine kinase NtrY
LDEILANANEIAGDYYHDRQMLVADHARRLAQSLAAVELDSADIDPIRMLLGPDVSVQRVKMVEIYRLRAAAEGRPALERILDVAAPDVPPGHNVAESDRLAEQALAGDADARSIEPLGAAGDFLHAAAVIVRDRRPVGVVVASDHLTGELAGRARRMTQAFESYSQLRVLKRPMTGLYLSIFLMLTLLILLGAVWMGSYLAKRITRPVLRLEAAARHIGAGRFDHHLEPESDDEFGALTHAFNQMADELAVSRRKVDRSTLELERKHLEVEGRRRYIETVLQRIATGVIAIDAAGAIITINTAAARLLGLDPAVTGQPAAVVFDRADLQPMRALLADTTRARPDPAPREMTILRDGREAHLAVAATLLAGDAATEGVVLVLDDVTPLIRAQKVAAWREVARRLAHEIKNPLTPIQLSADRIRRHAATAPAEARAIIDECTSTIVGEVESLKGLVDEFSQFARMPAPRTVLTRIETIITETLALYDGILGEVRIARHEDPGLPPVRIDPEQIRRVLINLIDNAIEAMERRGAIDIATERDRVNSLVRITIADAGPGIPAGERDKLFLPYYSTKRRGSGLGLAIVRRIIAEHGGTIEVSDNVPHGTRFTIELPC